MKTYITFGQVHKHFISDKVLDKDCVCVINHERPGEGREIAQMIFGDKFCFSYEEESFDFNSMKYYPRGFIEINMDLIKKLSAAIKESTRTTDMLEEARKVPAEILHQRFDI